MNLTCKYDAAHTGPFSNAVVLQKHYVAEHSDVYVPPVKEACSVCGKQVSDMAQHRRKKHAGTTVAVEKVEAPVPEPPRWTADHIVLPVVTELAGGKKGAIPVAKLNAVFAWRDATQRMLEQVQE